MNLVDAVAREQSVEMKKIDHCLLFSLELEATLRFVAYNPLSTFIKMYAPRIIFFSGEFKHLTRCSLLGAKSYFRETTERLIQVEIELERLSRSIYSEM